MTVVNPRLTLCRTVYPNNAQGENMSTLILILLLLLLFGGGGGY